MDDARRCTATSKQSGERCKRAARVGLTVCKIHGGGTKAAEAKSERAKEAARMDKTLASYVTDREGVTPAEAYAESLALVVGVQDGLRRLLQDVDMSDPKQFAEWLGFAVDVASKGAKVSGDGLKIGVAEKALTIEAAKGQLLGEALAVALGRCGLEVHVPAVLEELGRVMAERGLLELA